MSDKVPEAVKRAAAAEIRRWIAGGGDPDDNIEAILMREGER